VNPLDGMAGVRGHRHLDLALLDDPAGLDRVDPGGMLRATASAGAQVRESAALAAEAHLGSLAEEGRPLAPKKRPGRSRSSTSAPASCSKRTSRSVLSSPSNRGASICGR